jgi:hypothetical protein
MEWTQEKVDQVEYEIKQRAVADAGFRSLALSNPSAAISQITDLPLPPGFKVQFVDNAGANRTIVLPDLVPEVEELSEADLAHVAGGSNRNNVNA